MSVAAVKRRSTRPLRSTRLRLALTAAGLALAAGLPWGAAPPAEATPQPGIIPTQLGAGLSVVIPAGWHLARRLTGLTEPRERFTLASFALVRSPAAQRDCGPTRALRSMPPNGALAFVFEYGPHGSPEHGFPAQPKRFELPRGPALTYECFGLGWLLRFRSGARRFQAMVALGPRAGANRGRLLAALGSLRVSAGSKG